MELKRTQHILARLYTDSELRKRFFAPPSSAAEALGIAENEMLGLAPLSAEQVRVFATSLVRKRAREVSKLLPATVRALGGSFEPAFLSFAEIFKPGGIKKHCDDAVAFAEFLRARVREGGLAPRWLADLVGYEAARIEMAAPGRRYVLRWFRYPVVEILDPIQAGVCGGTPRARPTLGVWVRPFARGRLRHFLVSFPSAFGTRIVTGSVPNSG